MSKKLRREVGQRAGWRCDACGRPVPEEVGQAHHRKLRSRGGGDSLANLMWVCGACHGWIHGNPALATTAGWMVPSWGDPGGFSVKRYDGERYMPGADWTRQKETR
ncbi:HNH endonuclease [Georgenia sp. MJ170]|uniref:HNH endonuclease n=1 Tax=Georgenia sunbinii TaxID=3117728 RepID=UPI002F267D43